MSRVIDFFVTFLSSRVLALVFMVSAVIFAVFVRYGGGTILEAVEVQPTAFYRPVERVVEAGVPLRRIVVAPDQSVYGVVHPKFQQDDLKLVKIAPDGEISPFPNEDWQRVVLKRPTALTIDARGYLWIAEDHMFGLEPAKIMAIDIDNGRVVVEQVIGRDRLPRGSMLSDMVLSPDGMQLFVADSSPLRLTPILLQWDLNNGQFATHLTRHSSIQAQRYHAQVDDIPFGAPLRIKVHREGLNALALSENGQSLIYASAAHNGLFSIPLNDLMDANGPSTEARISKLSKKPWSEAIATDFAGNVYLADTSAGQILRLAPNGQLTALVPEGTFRWPSGLAFGPGGYLYVSETALHIPRWRQALSDVLDNAPLGLGRWLASQARGSATDVGKLGVWRIDVGVAGQPG